jgi:DNA mismatch repair protein MutL
MPKIKSLPPDIISKIAAGEVIERPAYAVKELIENAIDAEATAIRIEIEKSGLEKIAVLDNGIGMTKEDIGESFKPHTTSKIAEEGDLVGIKSLGFRGEALSSIAAISHVLIKSRTAGAISGYEVEIHEGKVEDTKPVGMPPGTMVEVQHIFHSTPVRKNFLKSSQVEFRYILSMVIQYALAFPTIHFSLYHNKKNIINVPQNQGLEERITYLLGEDIFKNLVPLKNNHEHVKISGFISKPLLSSPFQKAYLFVNGRSVKNKKVVSTIKNTYGTLLPPESIPLFIIFLHIPHEMVDVNIHPRKEDVAFHNENQLMEVIKEAVSSALLEYNLTYTDARWQKGRSSFSRQMESKIRDGAMTSYAAALLKEEKLPWELQKKMKIKKDAHVQQVHNLYILVETEQGVVMVDQHAAHERILYEQFKEKMITHLNKKDVFKLQKPVVISLSTLDKEVLKEYEKDLNKMGFIFFLDEKGNVTIDQVPLLFKDRQPAMLLRELLNEFTEDNATSAIDRKTNLMLSYLACRAAVKAGDELTKKECLNLVQQLEKTPNSYTCPHGRPTKYEFALKELHKLFKR